jgi:hypothetical protein
MGKGPIKELDIGSDVLIRRMMLVIISKELFNDKLIIEHCF